jgi:hypothetical protein
MRRIAIAIAGLTIVAACDVKRPTAVLIEQIPTTYFAEGPSGLVQTININPPPFAEDVDPVIGITSVIKNTDQLKGVRVIVRSCTLLPEDVQTSFGQMAAYGENECAKFLDTLDLAPGQSTPAVRGEFLADVAAGVYEITVEHSKTPAFLAKGRFRKR